MQLRASYTIVNHIEQIVGASSLCFSADGTHLYCGSSKAIRTFDVSRPGRECSLLDVSDRRQNVLPLSSIISTIAVSPDGGRLLAAGCYNRCAALYSTTDASCVFTLANIHRGGITHVGFSPDGKLLCTGARKDSCIHVWDIRKSSGPLFTLPRPVDTNQKISFSMFTYGEDQCIISGTTEGRIVAYSLSTGEPQDHLSAPSLSHNNDAVNGVSIHPFLPYIATATGQRAKFVFPSYSDDSSSDDESSSSDEAISQFSDTQLRIFQFPSASSSTPSS